MREVILRALEEIEERENVRVLLAVESGSRAWGFASPDSDYDVRFIYLRKKEDYLRLEKVRDVIELPVDEVLDVNGWDLQKTLRLLHASNPTLFEWFSSPIVYRETEFAGRFRSLMGGYFSTRKALAHYLSMAEGNYREYLKGEMVRAKKYFYVLRPILVCGWILDRGTPPPMRFSELAEDQLDPDLRPVVDGLLELKMRSPEIREIPRLDALNGYLDRRIEEIGERIRALPKEPPRDWEELDRFFLETIRSK